MQGLTFATLATAAGTAVLWEGIGRTVGILCLVAAAFYNGVYTLFPFSNFYLLLLFAGIVAERLVWRLL